MRNNLQFQASSVHGSVVLLLILLGAIAAGYGLYSAPERTWLNLLLNGFYVTSLGVSAIFFLTTQRLTGARWSAGLRRIPEALMLILPVVSVLLLVVWFGRQTIYPWSRPGIFAHEPSIAGKVAYLQVPFVFGRMTLVLALWGIFAWLFRRASLEQDRHATLSLTLHHRLNRYAAVFAVLFAFSFTAGAYDWIISLDPSWFSTMFAVYLFAGTFVQGIAAVTLAAILLKARGYLSDFVNEHHLHDLGKMLFAFSTFWAYIWTCQYLLIWYGNIPEEITHFLKRTNGPWLLFFALNFCLNWIVPFTVLLSIRAKRNPTVLKVICIVLLCGHWLDLYVIIMPSMWSVPAIGVLEVAIAAGYAALVYLLFLWNLAKAPLVPVHDPVLAAEAHAFHKDFRLHLVPGVES